MSVVMWAASKAGKQPIKRIRTLTMAVFCVLLYFFYAGSDSSWSSDSYNWARHRHFYPVDKSDMAHLPVWRPTPKIPRIQTKFATAAGHRDDTHWEICEMRRWEVKEAFEHAWKGYKKQAWGWDELMPVSGGHRNVFNGWGATLIDTLDTLWIMDMKDEFNEAVEHVAGLDFNNLTQPNINLFETNIRYLGGLLGAYDLSGEKILLRKATELGHMLYAAFDTSTRMPTLPFFNPDNARAGAQKPPFSVSSAGVGSLSMEFTRLAQLTGNMKFYDAIDRVKSFLFLSQETSKLPGMWPMSLQMGSIRQSGMSHFTIGAEADSLYEYLPKMYILLNGTDKQYETMWLRAAMTIEQNLLFKPMIPKPIDILFSGSLSIKGHLEPKMRSETGHLDCFAGGMFALGGRLFDIQRHVDVGTKLAQGCSWAYRQFPAGVMPEFLSFVPCESRDGPCKYNETLFEKAAKEIPEGIFSVRDPRYLLRPEAIESIFVAFRTTGKIGLQNVAWEMFTAIRDHTKTKYGNGQIKDVNDKESRLENIMEASEISLLMTSRHLLLWTKFTNIHHYQHRAFGYRKR
ncbi:glycosyl hydrolase family 47 [Zalerion maritima]|uniref:alpha-1,2-Mannosidase n=1 Tax=Zalerion maritima TaxID=339359 RepID=A0AAD5RGK3_9PEZI|nr:glycosyl hydrolase family 47 [Zalerion maritima]